MVLGVHAVLVDEAGGDGRGVGVDVGCRLLLGSADVHAYLESLIFFAVGGAAVAAGGPLSWRHGAEALSTLVKGRLREHLLPLRGLVCLRTLER